MRNKIGFIGFGDLGKQIALLLVQNGFSENDFLYFDDSSSLPNSFPFESWNDKQFSDVEFIVALGYKYLKLKDEIISSILETGKNLLTFIHPTSFINPTAKIGKGVIIYPMCNIDQYVTIGDGAFLNNSVCVSHHSIVGDCNFMAPGVVISGNVTTGKCSFFGSGTVISNNIRIGNSCTIGTASNVTHALADNTHAIGNPIRILDKPLKLT